MPRNPDPKHGRWILPLIIAAMIVLTITFVTSLKPAETEAGTTTTAPVPTTTTTTTLPPEVATFMTTLDVYETQTNAFSDDVTGVNSQWETGQIAFNDARDGFEAIRLQVVAWEDQVAGATDVPSALAAGHVELVLTVEDLAPAIADIIAGLEAPDDGTLRRQAIVAFEDQIDTILAAIQDLRDQAQQTGLPDGGEDGTTSTTSGEEPTTSIPTSTTSTTAGTDA